MDYYKKLNAEFAEQIQTMRKNIQEHIKEIISLRECYFEERFARISLKKSVTFLISECQEALETNSNSKVMLLLQKFNNEVLNNGDGSYKRQSRRSSCVMARELRRSSIVLQQTFPEVSPTKSILEEEQQNQSEHEEEVCRKRLDMENIIYEDDHEDESMSSTPQTGDKESSSEEEKFTFDKKSMSPRKMRTRKVLNDINNLPLSEKASSPLKPKAKTYVQDDHSSFITIRRSKLFPAANENHTTLDTSPIFSTREISCSTPFAEIDLNQSTCNGVMYQNNKESESREKRPDSLQSTTNDMTNNKTSEMEQGSRCVRPSRQCKPKNLTEPRLGGKLRNDSGTVLVKKGRTRKKQK